MAKPDTQTVAQMAMVLPNGLTNNYLVRQGDRLITAGLTKEAAEKVAAAINARSGHAG